MPSGLGLGIPHTFLNTFNASAQLTCSQYHLFLMLSVSVYPNLILIDRCRHKYVTPRGLLGFFKGNKSSHTIASVGVMSVTSHVEVVELKGEREVRKSTMEYLVPAFIKSRHGPCGAKCSPCSPYLLSERHEPYEQPRYI